MAENFRPKHEITHSNEINNPEETDNSAEKLQHLHEQARRTIDTSQERADHARQMIENEPDTATEHKSTLHGEQNQRDTTEVRWWSSELKYQTLERTLASVQRRLSVPERTFSKVIHQKVVEQASDAAGNTIARPSGLLIGSLCAFIGSAIAYLIARRIGGELSPSIGLLFFVGGFAVGLVGEFLIYILRKLYAQRSHTS